MRARRADTPQGYIPGLASIGSIKTNKALTMHHNKMYEGTVDRNETQAAHSSLEKYTGTTSRTRKAKLEKLLEIWDHPNIKERTHIEISVMDNDAFAEYSRSSNQQSKKVHAFFKKYGMSFGKIADFIHKKTLPCSFLEYLMKNTKLSQCAMACIGSNSPTTIWFKKIF